MFRRGVADSDWRLGIQLGGRLELGSQFEFRRHVELEFQLGCRFVLGKPRLW
jgi:hypothetical protein